MILVAWKLNLGGLLSCVPNALGEPFGFLVQRDVAFICNNFPLGVVEESRPSLVVASLLDPVALRRCVVAVGPCREIPEVVALLWGERVRR